MRTVSTGHAYDKYANDKSSSEAQRIIEINHFMEREGFERFKKTDAEKLEPANAIANYPNKNHKPIS